MLALKPQNSEEVTEILNDDADIDASESSPNIAQGFMPECSHSFRPDSFDTPEEPKDHSPGNATVEIREKTVEVEIESDSGFINKEFAHE